MDIAERIEAFVTETVAVIASGDLPTFSFQANSASSQFLAFETPTTLDPENLNDGEEGEEFELEWEERSLDTTLNNYSNHQQPILCEAFSPPKPMIQESVIERNLISKDAIGAFPIARMFRVMSVVYAFLLEGRKCTQRELYYRLLDPPMFASMKDVTDAIRDVCCILQVPRSALNICCTPKGAFSGAIRIQLGNSTSWLEGMESGIAGFAIPGDVDEIERMQMECVAECVVVIEKDAIFQRLTEDRIFDTIPVALVTGKGMPDLATRIFLQKFSFSFPHLKIFGLVDWNPSGVAILNVYKNGSNRIGSWVHPVRLPSLQWLGIRSRMLVDMPYSAFQSLGQRDIALIHSLSAQLRDSDWVQELHIMKMQGLKCDIEAMYQITSLSGLSQLLIHCIDSTMH